MSEPSSVLFPIYPYVLTLSRQYKSFLEVTSSPVAYAEALYHTITYVKETVPTLIRVAESRPAHPASAWLIEHAQEEAGHDIIFQEDLDLICQSPVFPNSTAISDFICLERTICNCDDPVSTIFGDIAVLECFPPTLDEVNKIVAKFDVPNNSARGYRLHAEVDDHHRYEALEWMRSPQIDLSVVYIRATVVCRLFCRHWNWLAQRYQDH